VYSELDDGELLVLSANHPDAFGELYRRHAEALMRFFARRTFDPEVAAELTAETFAEAFASRERFRDRGTGGAEWLYGIARHELGRFFRRGRVEARARQRLGMPLRMVSDEDYDRIEEMIDLTNVRRATVQAMAMLPDEQREAVTLRVVEGLPYPEVARLLSCTEEAARARVSRGLRKLPKLLEGRSLEIEAGS